MRSKIGRLCFSSIHLQRGDARVYIRLGSSRRCISEGLTLPEFNEQCDNGLCFHRGNNSLIVQYSVGWVSLFVVFDL